MSNETNKSIQTKYLQNILNPVHLQQLAQSWLLEDQSGFDLQAVVCDGKSIEAIVWCKTEGSILAGVPFVDAIAKELGVIVIWYTSEGIVMPAKTALLKGKASDILRMERVALNVLARCSGIATATRKVRCNLDSLGWKGILAGTRKTTPGFRVAEKYSLVVGGASPHRYDLSHMVMIKDNHVAICGNIKDSVQKVRDIGDFSSKIELECSSWKEAEEAIHVGVDVILLDNFRPKELIEVADKLRKIDPEKKTLIEASGGITGETIDSFLSPSVDIISMSCLVQGYPAVDFSLRVSCLISKETD